MLKLRVLGSAAGGGFPQWNCNCPRCHGLRTGAITAVARTQSSIATTVDDQRWVLFNASPDILAQLQSFPTLQPARRLRDTGIEAIVLMDAQIDHTTGLYMLREHQRRWPVWCTAAVHEDLSRGNPLFELLEHYCGLDWHDINASASSGAPTTIAGIDITALPLTSNAPPYSPHRDRPVIGDTIGVRLVDPESGRSVFYAPGLGKLEDTVWQAMCDSDAVLVDGTMWHDRELIELGASTRSARAMGHLPQAGPDGMIEWLDRLPASTQKILIHINNTNPILDEHSPERHILREHGIDVAYDGMEILI